MHKIIRFIHLMIIAAMICVLAGTPLSTQLKTATAQSADPIPGLLSQISETNLVEYVTALVGYGPRLANAYQVYTDAACTYGDHGL